MLVVRSFSESYPLGSCSLDVSVAKGRFRILLLHQLL